eukprot:CAMPEP_0197048552 /NCGR_PEP_ID=MMETSP1384-20130603/23886_1 /TAXON_ID=29189 /ORGANISM="Ammonia sp." /LENGTH=103 /DNA_ID=CAMNT_0042480705 /DNA_START=85 /DNA_END=393 /DNA_ORIENTATION=-
MSRLHDVIAVFILGKQRLVALGAFDTGFVEMFTFLFIERQIESGGLLIATQTDLRSLFPITIHTDPIRRVSMMRADVGIIAVILGNQRLVALRAFHAGFVKIF